MKKIAYYITAHGYGHGARSCDIINALRKAAPTRPIIVKTDLPETFMQSRLLNGIELRRGAFDVGLIQKDSIQVDLDASLKALETLYAREPELIRQELDFMRSENIGVVVADIPAIPLAAAQQSALPNIATGNFGWDWIYEEFGMQDSRWIPYVEKFRAIYAQTDLLLRQPFAEPMESFPNRIDLPLLAEAGQSRKEKISDMTGADPGKRWVLLSFTSLDLEKPGLDQLAQLTHYEWFSVEPLEWKDSPVHCIKRADVCFSDVLASVDIVVTKPGFGILSECIANKKPIIYSERSHFREYGVLVQSIERYCRHAFIPNSELYAGQLDRALSEIKTAAEPRERMTGGGAELAAGAILERLTASE
jgi:L-arabinokinase